MYQIPHIITNKAIFTCNLARSSRSVKFVTGVSDEDAAEFSPSAISAFNLSLTLLILHGTFVKQRHIRT